MTLRVSLCGLALTTMIGLGGRAQAQPEDQSPKQLVQRAVASELHAAELDHTLWRYLKSEDGGNLFIEVDTAHGSIQRHVEQNGHPASPATIAADNAQIQRYIHDPSLQAKQRHDSANDDKNAAELLNLMPEAFLWKIVRETPEQIELSYTPNPGFSPPDMESRVMGGMSGDLIIHKEGFRIQTFKGHLDNDVTIGFGLLARLKAGGNFDIERRPVDGVHWEITQTHVHIAGHALFFKSISTQEDEVKTKWTPVPPDTTLEQAVQLLDEPLK